MLIAVGIWNQQHVEMARTVADKVALITGGAEGIGFSIAENLLKKGAKTVVLLDINEKLGSQAADALNAKYGDNKASFIKCDVTQDLESVSKHIIDKYKTVDILVNNAGILNETALKKTIDINVTAVLEWSIKFWEHMRKDEGGIGGTILNVASIYGFLVDPHAPIYKASKYAVMGFTKTLGHEDNYNKSGVRVVAICPGFTETNLFEKAPAIEDRQDQKDFDEFMKQQPWQTTEAVGKAAVEVFEISQSGTAWKIEGEKPIAQV